MKNAADITAVTGRLLPQSLLRIIEAHPMFATA